MIRGAALPQPRPGNALSQALLWLSSGPIDTNPIRTKQQQLSSNVGWAYVAVNRIGLDVRGADRKLWKRTGKKSDDWEEIPEDQVPAILTRPDGSMTMGEFVQTTVMHLDLTGEAYWHLITDRGIGGKVIGMQLVYPHWVDEPILDERGIITGWRVTIPGRSYFQVPAEDMVFLKYPHPMDPLRGLSPVEAYAITHDMDTYARAYASSLLKNRATPELVITVESELTKEQGDLIRSGWLDKYRDPANGPAVLGKGSKVQQLGLNIADLKFLELTQASRETILAIYGVPAAAVGLTTDFNRANAQTARATYWGSCINPRLDIVEEVFNARVMPRIKGKDPRAADTLWWGFDPPNLEDQDFALREADVMFKAGAVTLNEYRERLGRDNLGKDGDVYYMPMGVNVVSSVGFVTDQEDEPEPLPLLPPVNDNPEEDPKAIEPPKADEDEEEEKASARYMGEIKAMISNLPAVIQKAPDSKSLRMRAAKAEFLERQGKLERSLKSEVRKLFSKEQAALIKRLKKEGVRGIPHLRSVTSLQGETRDWTEEEIEEFSKEWESTLRDFMLRGMREGWLLAAADLPQSIAWDLYRKEAEEFARKLSSRKVTQIQETTRKGVQNIIGDGIASGATIDDMADDLRRLYDGFKGLRAEVISRSETSSSVNGGKQAQADEIEERLGLKLMKTWVSVQDERTRESHVAADGQTVPNGDQFQIGSAFLDQPGDPMGPPEEIIQCFPGETLVIAEGVKKAFRRWYDGDLVEITTSAGHKLAGTPNHPILTGRGWQVLGALNEGDSVICCGLGQFSDVEAIAHPDVKDVPAPIREVYDALAEVSFSAKRVTGANVDFHGDGSDGQVDIVFAERELRDVGVPSGVQPSSEKVFPISDLGEGLGLGCGHPLGGLIAPGDAKRSRMASRDLTRASLSVHGGPLQTFCLALAAPWNASNLEQSGNDISGNAEIKCDSVLGHATLVEHGDVPSIGLGVCSAQQPHGGDGVSSLAEPLYGLEDPRRGDAENAGDFVTSLPFPVEGQSIVGIRRVKFSGHVYNLELDQGLYIANGIVSHNCRCTLTYSEAE